MLVRLIREQNALWNKVSSLTFDYLSNIKTIITLRFEERVKESLLSAINLIQGVFNKYAFFNERKWFTVNMTLAIVTSVIVGIYVYKEFSLNGVVVIGTVSMLFQYIGRMSSAFYNFAWQYSGLVQDKANVQSVDHIVESYDNMKEKHAHDDFTSWKNIHISFPGFTYGSSDIVEERQILHAIDLPIKKSQKIAFV